MKTNQLTEEINQKMKEIGQEIARLREEQGITLYRTKVDYSLREHQTRGVIAGDKSYTIQTLLLVLSELNYTITLTPKP